MASLTSIKESARSIIGDREEAKLCLLLIDEIGRHLGDKRGPWTYQAFSKWVGVSPTDPKLLDCIGLLATSSSMKALDVKFLFFDPSVPEDIGQPLSDEDVAAALDSGVFYHPDTGEKVSDFKSTLVPYFVPSSDLTPAD